MSNIIDSIRLSGTTYQIQGEITVDAALDSGSTNPVANSAITTALDDKVNVVDNEVPQFTTQGDMLTRYYPASGTPETVFANMPVKMKVRTSGYDPRRIDDIIYINDENGFVASGNCSGSRGVLTPGIPSELQPYLTVRAFYEGMNNLFEAKKGYRISYVDATMTDGDGKFEPGITPYFLVYEGGQSADVIKDVIEPTLINKQDQLVSGTNIKTINNTSILGSGNIDIQGGGGKAIEAGRGIVITTGETADTVSFNLPISAGTETDSIAEGFNTTATGWGSHAEGNGTTAKGSSSHAEGNYTKASGQSSHAEGNWTTASGDYSHAEGSDTVASGMSSHAEGINTKTRNQSEHASGQYNVSSNASTTFGDSGNTLFSVGNGTANNARHNAFEIRQNGDIYISSGNTDIKLQDHLGGGGSVTVDDELSPTSENPVQNKVIYNKFDEVEEVTAAGLNALNSKITPTVELTQAEYDALTPKDPNTYYIITDAEAGDLTNYYTKSETNTLLGGKADTAATYTKTEVDTALGGKQATLVSGTNIKTINNESILGSGNIDIQGGSTYTAGRGISIANDTISFSLPISAGTGTNSIIGGKGGSTQGNYSFVFGLNNTCGRNTIGTYVFGESNTIGYGCSYTSVGGYSNTATTAQGGHIEGLFNNITNNMECAYGRCNVSNKATTTFGDSGNTLFSVGNGTSTSARHNAFEIRQNGDIYLTKDGQDVKLQDQLGGSSITVDASLDSGSTNPVENRVIYNKIDEVEQVTAAGLNALNDNFGGLKLVKLTQAEYNALATKDSSTLYIIVN